MRTAAERQDLIENSKEDMGATYRLWVRDNWRDLSVYKVPVESLLINSDNRRFRAERMLVEEALGRSLDPENRPEDELSVEALLLDRSLDVDESREQVVGKPSDDAEALEKDWLLRGQETPLWIRPDGTVRNGNRRLAVVKRLQRKTGDTGLGHILVVILSEDEVDEPSLLEMEQREQLTENFKVRYNDIDYLLALKEAAEHRDIDWYDRDSLDEVAGQLQSMVEKSAGEVVRDLYAIRYMDLFLELSEQSGEYHRVLRTLEIFRDIGRAMKFAETEFTDEQDAILQVFYSAVRSGKKYQDIRSLRGILRKDKARFDELAEEILDIEHDWADTGDKRLDSKGLDEAFVVDDDDDDDDQGSVAEVPSYPRLEAGSAIDITIDGFQASQVESVVVVLSEILNRLDALPPDSLDGHLANEQIRDEIRAALVRIFGWVDESRARLDDLQELL